MNHKATEIAESSAWLFLLGGSGSDEENDATEQEQDKSKVTKQGEDISDDGNDDNDNNNEDDDNDDDDESEIAVSASAITVGELIAAMKTKKKKAAAPSQPSSVVSNFSISVAVSKYSSQLMITQICNQEIFLRAMHRLLLCPLQFQDCYMICSRNLFKYLKLFVRACKQWGL